MDNFKKIAYILLLIVILVLGYIVYCNVAENDKESIELNDKVLAEIKYLEEELVYILNLMNNITTEAYELVENEINIEDNQEEDKEENEKEEESKEDLSVNSSNESVIEYELEKTYILGNTDTIDWTSSKIKIEEIYVSIPTITLDLYQIGISSDEITSFNNTIDEIAIALEKENKQEVLDSVITSYIYISTFLEKVDISDVYKKNIKAKENIYLAYSILDTNNKEQINEYVQNADNIYYELMLDNNINNENKTTINKIYIMINELQNSINLESNNVFLIKYVNLVEEMEKI